MELRHFSASRKAYGFLCAAVFCIICMYSFKLQMYSKPIIARARVPSISGNRVRRKYAMKSFKNLSTLKQKKILLWTVPFNDYAMPAENVFVDPFPDKLLNMKINSSMCGSCLLTYDRQELNNSAAVVFHALYPEQEDELPAKINSSQVYVWWSQESAQTKTYYTYLHEYFDWTMTVSPTADVYSPYASFPWLLKFLSKRRKFGFFSSISKMKGVWIEDEKADDDDELYALHSSTKRRINVTDVDPLLRDLILKKDRLSAWVTSNCDTHGAVIRGEVMDGIEDEGLKVDRFGNCAYRPFPIYSRWDPAFYDYLSRYKFYFSFENSIHCRGYHTEKLWYNALYSGAVPVIWGPHKNDIRDVLPPKSYIHVEDFQSIHHLVKYLKYLDRNDTAYVGYLEWRTWVKYLDKNGEYDEKRIQKLPLKTRPSRKVRALLHKYAKMQPIGFCNLCKKLHGTDLSVRRRSVFAGIDLDERDVCLDWSKAQQVASRYITVEEPYEDKYVKFMNII